MTPDFQVWGTETREAVRRSSENRDNESVGASRACDDEVRCSGLLNWTVMKNWVRGVVE